jgi:hypothetical protein
MHTFKLNAAIVLSDLSKRRLMVDEEILMVDEEILMVDEEILMVAELFMLK